MNPLFGRILVAGAIFGTVAALEFVNKKTKGNKPDTPDPNRAKAPASETHVHIHGDKATSETKSKAGGDNTGSVDNATDTNGSDQTSGNGDGGQGETKDQ